LVPIKGTEPPAWRCVFPDCTEGAGPYTGIFAHISAKGIHHKGACRVPGHEGVPVPQRLFNDFLL